MAATGGLSPCHEWVEELPGAGASWREVKQSDKRRTTPVDAASPLRHGKGNLMPEMPGGAQALGMYGFVSSASATFSITLIDTCGHLISPWPSRRGKKSSMTVCV
jgi:hypothetical protein